MASKKLLRAPDQDHDVAGPHGAAGARAVVLDGFARIRPAQVVDRVGDAPRHHDGRVAGLDDVDRQLPVPGLGLGLGRHGGPDLDAARQGLQGLVRLGPVGVVGQPAPVRAMGEDPVDGAEHGRGRAEGQDEVDAREGPSGAPGPGREVPAHLVEHVGPGALERVDRLFLVADRKERAVLRGAAGPGEELIRDCAQDLPLLGRRVLGLVHQDVVDAAVELVEHPGRTGGRQQVPGALDQILEVEEPAPALGRVVVVEDRARHRHQGGGALGRVGSLAPGQEAEEPRLFGIERIAQCRLPGAQRLRQVGGGPGLALGGEEDVEIGLDLPALGRVEGRHQAVAGLARAAAVRPDGPRGLGPAGPGQAILDHGGRHCGGCLPRGEAERRPQGREQAVVVAGVAKRVAHEMAVAERLADEALEGRGRDLAGQGGEAAAERRARLAQRPRQHSLARPQQEVGGVEVVQHLEPGRDVALEREQVQQALAEGVDGLDLQPARRLDRAGEQPSRLVERLGSRGQRRHGRPGVGDGGAQGGVVEPRPAREVAEHPDRHVGGGRLGEGEAQDARGRDARQQQPQHPLGEHMRLARAGIGRHPGRGAGMGGAALALDRVGRDGGGGVRPGGGRHGSAPSPVPPVADHSLTRARWS